MAPDDLGDNETALLNRVLDLTKWTILALLVVGGFLGPSVAGNDGILDELGSIDNITAKLAVIGFVLELLGITDLANFDDDGRVKAYNILQRVSQRAEEKGVTFAAGEATLDTLIEILSLGRFDTGTYNA